MKTTDKLNELLTEKQDVTGNESKATTWSELLKNGKCIVINGTCERKPAIGNLTGGVAFE